MISKHVSEEEIQLYVLNPVELAHPARQHIEQCMDCQLRLKEYEALFTAIQSLDKPAFDFDVAALVLPQLEEKRKTSWYRLPLIILGIAASIALLLLPLVIFGGGDKGYNINSLVSTLSPWVIGIISLMAIGFIGINIWDHYNRYRHQLEKLNFQ